MTTSVRRRLAGLALTLTLALAAAPLSASAAGAYSVNVAQRGDYVAQTNFVQCVGASMQMMLNMIEPGADRSSHTQLRLQNLAREWSGRRPDGDQRQGASVRGWAAGLNLMGAGPYKLVGSRTLEDAMRTAAVAIAETGKPVGLLVWRGRHAWVMSGFRSTGDPRTDPDARITHAIVQDPLYPHGSSVWGPSPDPGEALTPAALSRQFVPRRMGSWNRQTQPGSTPSLLSGMYVLVLPYDVDHSERLDRAI